MRFRNLGKTSKPLTKMQIHLKFIDLTIMENLLPLQTNYIYMYAKKGIRNHLNAGAQVIKTNLFDKKVIRT